MRQEITDEYQRLYDNYGARAAGPAPEGTRISRVKAAIEAAEAALPGLELRSDARYLLLVNFYQMILRPLVGLPEFRLISDEALFEDVTNILRVASGGSSPGTPDVEELDGDEITGNAIIRALGKVIDALRVSDAEIWG